jgi:hypothetical protein
MYYTKHEEQHEKLNLDEIISKLGLTPVTDGGYPRGRGETSVEDPRQKTQDHADDQRYDR